MVLQYLVFKSSGMSDAFGHDQFLAAFGSIGQHLCIVTRAFS